MIRLNVFFLILSLLSIVAAAPIKRSLPLPINVYLPSTIPDIWDFSSEFSNLCSNLYPVDDETNEPRFIDSRVRRVSVDDEHHPDVVEVSCVYQYPSGIYIQLALFIAEELGSQPLDVAHAHGIREEVAMIERRKDVAGVHKLRMGKRI